MFDKDLIDQTSMDTMSIQIKTILIIGVGSTRTEKKTKTITLSVEVLRLFGRLSQIITW